MSGATRQPTIDNDLQRRTTAGRSSLEYDRDGSGSTSRSKTASPATDGSPANLHGQSVPRPTHQRFVLTDPVAFRYLEEDPSTNVLARRQKLEGYECYLVEQWACSRTHPTFIITTYTGDPSHIIVVSVLSVPTDEEAWSPRLKVYFKALNQYHARRRETPLGTLMITNLSGFPSSLTVIPFPEGDAKKYREDFFVNENLKRLGCSGRAGLALTKPNPATQAKFHQLYRISDKIPLYGAVIELVKLSQVALMLFGILAPEYADGLLCDVTEKAINDWWLEFGFDYYNVEPHDGILGPTTVAALLGTLMGARNRLNAYGAPVAKDVFEVESTKRGIAYFQKSQRIPKSRRLDRQTLERLHRATAKAASGEGWTMPRAVKSTVAELSGKGGEMVMEMVGGRDKAGIADVETVDIERFVQLVYGERAKWLWYGKPRKSHSGPMFDRLQGDEGLVFEKDEHGGYAWASRRKNSVLEEPPSHRRYNSFHGKQVHHPEDIAEGGEPEQSRKRTTFQKAAGKVTDARSGLGRIKDAVGLRGHHHKHSRDGVGIAAVYGSKNDGDRLLRQTSSEQASPTSPHAGDEDFDRLHTASDDRIVPSDMENHNAPGPMFTKALSHTPLDSRTTLFSDRNPMSDHDEQPELDAILTNEAENEPKTPTAENSIAGSIYRGVDLDDLFATEEDPNQHVGLSLRRTNSYSEFIERHYSLKNDNRWPRHLSFSVAEDSVLTWDPFDWDAKDDPSLSTDPKQQLTKELAAAEDAKRLREQLSLIDDLVAEWATRQVTAIRELDQQADHDQEELDALYYPRMDEYQALRVDSKEILAEERAHLQEAVKDIEVLGAKLEYEINALRGKVEDVEDGVAEFERQMRFVESRVAELEDEGPGKEGWVAWGVRVLTGLGRAPSAA